MRWEAAASARRIPVLLGCLAVAGLLLADALVLSRSPCVGVADIHDFWRVMAPAGIEHTEPLERPGYFVVCTFKTGPVDLASAPSSSALLAWLARQVSWGFEPLADLMDLRQVGLLHLLIVALCAALALAARAPAALVAGAVYVISDPGYLLFFNSFYADPALFVAFVGIVLWLAIWGDLPAAFWRQPRWRLLARCVALVALVAVGGMSKMQYILLPAVTLAVLLPGMAAGWAGHKKRVTFLAVALLAVSASAAWLFFRGPGPRFVRVNDYHAVFGGILELTSDPERVLRALGLPEEHWDLPRQDVFSAGIPRDHPVHDHLTPLSRTTLLRLYATDPPALQGVRKNVESVLALRRAHPRGNFVRGPDTPRIQFYETRWQFARLRGLLFDSWPLAAWTLCALGCLWLSLRFGLRKWGPLESTMVFLLAWFGSQVVIAVLGEGLINLHQHMMGARLALDLLLVCLVVAAGREVHSRIGPGSTAKPTRSDEVDPNRPAMPPL